MTGHRVENVRVVLLDGAAHAVDSNELSFHLAAIGAFRERKFEFHRRLRSRKTADLGTDYGSEHDGPFGVSRTGYCIDQ